MQTEQLLSLSGMTDTEHSTTSSSNEEEVIFRKGVSLQQSLKETDLIIQQKAQCVLSYHELNHQLQCNVNLEMSLDKTLTLTALRDGLKIYGNQQHFGSKKIG